MAKPTSKLSSQPLFDALFSSLRNATDLGHAARDEAFIRQVAMAVDCGGGPVGPAAAGLGPVHERTPMADLASFYRFAGNEKASLEAMRQARAAATLERAEHCGELMLVMHDVTELSYYGHDSKEDRRALGDGQGLGYEYHCCLAVGASSGAPLGVLHDTVVSKSGPDDADSFDYQGDPTFKSLPKAGKKRLPTNHKHQFAVHAQGLASTLGGRPVVHVGDSEFDDVFIMLACEDASAHFVLRTRSDRLVQVLEQPWMSESLRTPQAGGHPAPPGYIHSSVHRLLPFLTMHPYKTVFVDAKGRISEEHTSLGMRPAKLEIASLRVRLYRPAKRSKKYFETPRPVEVNLVCVVEKHPPQGVQALNWTLYTNLETDTPDKQAAVAQHYRLRWKVESYFRLLKSGYRLEDCRLEDAGKIARLAIVLSLAAMAILQLKEAAGLPASGKLSEEDHRRLKEAMQAPDPAKHNLALRLMAQMARLGGWLARRNDPLGPDVLMRGARRLAAILDATVNHAGLLAELTQNPELLKGLVRV